MSGKRREGDGVGRVVGSSGERVGACVTEKLISDCTCKVEPGEREGLEENGTSKPSPLEETDSTASLLGSRTSMVSPDPDPEPKPPTATLAFCWECTHRNTSDSMHAYAADIAQTLTLQESRQKYTSIHRQGKSLN